MLLRAMLFHLVISSCSIVTSGMRTLRLWTMDGLFMADDVVQASEGRETANGMISSFSFNVSNYSYASS